MMSILKQLGDIITKGPWAWQNCFLCALPSYTAICRPCFDVFTPLPSPHCPVCARSCLDGGLCGYCRLSPPAFNATYTRYVYDFPLKNAIIAFKNQHLNLVPILATQMFKPPSLFESTLPPIDCVMPVPLAAERLRERGYNQSYQLARSWAKQYRLPVDPFTLQKIRNTPSQANLSYTERARNIKGAFTCSKRLDGLHIGVVDDVMTTGSTLNEVAHTLKKHGAVKVSNWVLARALLQNG